MRHNSQNVNFLALQNPQPNAGGFVEVEAFAKINLFLDIVRKRQDGYHDIISVMQAVNLYDSLLIQKSQPGAKPVQLDINIPGLPADDTNLVVKAANLLINEYDIRHPIHIKLTKRIPMGAGLGGGSSDCAATMHGINRLFGLRIPLDKLMEMGKTLGADVPFCLYANIQGSAAIVRGIGEKLEPLRSYANYFIILACPKIHVSTKEIFAKLQLNISGNNADKSLDKFISTYESEDICKLAKKFYNIFTPVTSGLHPQIAKLIIDLQKHGALGAEMTGTGATIFAYFDNEHNAIMACNILETVHADTEFFVTTTR